MQLGSQAMIGMPALPTEIETFDVVAAYAARALSSIRWKSWAGRSSACNGRHRACCTFGELRIAANRQQLCTRPGRFGFVVIHECVGKKQHGVAVRSDRAAKPRRRRSHELRSLQTAAAVRRRSMPKHFSFSQRAEPASAPCQFDTGASLHAATRKRSPTLPNNQLRHGSPCFL